MKIIFTRTEIYETEGPNKGPVFEKGHVYEMPEDKASRWINRDAAKAVDEKTPIGLLKQPEQIDAVSAWPPTAEALGAMKFAQLGELLASRGLSADDIKALNSTAVRQTKVADLAAAEANKV